MTEIRPEARDEPVETDRTLARASTSFAYCMRSGSSEMPWKAP